MTPLRELGSIGLIVDQDGFELAPNAFTAVQNMRFYRGWAERSGGHIQIMADTAVTPYYIQSHSSATTNYLAFAGIAAVYVDDGTTRTDITGTTPTGAVADRWTGGTFGGLLVLNNGVDSPMYWDNNTANNLATLTGWTAGHKCKALRPFKNFLVALNVTKSSTAYPHMVKWSDSAEAGSLPASWNEADPTNDAGESPALAETPDVIVDGLPLGDTFVIYKERSMYGMQLIGGNDIFRFFRLPGDSGALARGCIAAFPGGHVVLTQGDVVVHNLQGPQSIVDKRMRRRIFDTIDPTNFAASFVVANLAKEEVWICYPTSGNSVCNRAVVWNWTDNTLSERDLPNVTYATHGVVNVTSSTGTWADTSLTWTTDTGTWASGLSYAINDARLFMASSGSKLYVADETDSADGASFVATIERTGLHFDDADMVKMCRGAWLRIDAAPGTTISVQLGASMDAAISPTWETAQTFTAGTSQRIDAFVTGRFLAYRVTSTGTAPWRLRSIDLDIIPGGQY